MQGLGGVEGLPDATHPGVRARLGQQYETRRAIEGLSAAVRDTWKDGAGTKITVVSTGPLTNIALFVPTVLPCR
jgi:uridine nucleosidase